MQKKNKRPLGKGLSQLLGEDTVDPSPENTNGASETPSMLSLDLLCPGKYQPRNLFDSEKLNALTLSIRENGVLQPILVRPKGEFYEIVAGERRWRASKMAGLQEIPVRIMDFSDAQALESGLIENIQRDDLTPIEEASAYKHLIEEFQYSQEQLSQKIGKSRSHIANTLRLLMLPPYIQDQVNSGKISPGHARLLVGHEDAEKIADRVIQLGLNVRQLENYMKTLRENPHGFEKNPPFHEDKNHIETQISQLIGFKTQLRLNHRGGGVIEIGFSSMQDIDTLMQTLMKMRGYAL